MLPATASASACLVSTSDHRALSRLTGSPQEPPKAQAKKPEPLKKQQAHTKPKPKKPVTVTGSL